MSWWEKRKSAPNPIQLNILVYVVSLGTDVGGSQISFTVSIGGDLLVGWTRDMESWAGEARKQPLILGAVGSEEPRALVMVKGGYKRMAGCSRSHPSLVYRNPTNRRFGYKIKTSCGRRAALMRAHDTQITDPMIHNFS